MLVSFVFNPCEPRSGVIWPRPATYCCCKGFTICFSICFTMCSFWATSWLFLSWLLVHFGLAAGSFWSGSEVNFDRQCSLPSVETCAFQIPTISQDCDCSFDCTHADLEFYRDGPVGFVECRASAGERVDFGEQYFFCCAESVVLPYRGGYPYAFEAFSHLSVVSVSRTAFTNSM